LIISYSVIGIQDLVNGLISIKTWNKIDYDGNSIAFHSFPAIIQKKSSKESKMGGHHENEKTSALS